MVWHALEEVRAQKSNLATMGLDIANVYWFTHPQVVFCVTQIWYLSTVTC